MLLQVKADDKSPRLRGYARVKNLIEFLEDLLSSIKRYRNDPEFNDEIWVLLSGDKGGTPMKLTSEIINNVWSGSRDVVHPYCIYEAIDSHENMWKVHGHYIDQILMLQNYVTKQGKKIENNISHKSKQTQKANYSRNFRKIKSPSN